MAEQPLQCRVRLGDRSRAVRLARGQQPRRLLQQPRPGVDHDLARRQQLAREVGRADRGAAPAFGAAEAVQQVLPGELFDVLRAEHLHVLRLEVHRLHRALGTGAARVREEGVDQRRQHVQVLAVRQVVGEDQQQQRVQPPAHRVAAEERRGRASADGDADQPPQRVHARFLAVRQRRGEAEHEQERDHQHRDHRQDEDRIALVRAVALQPPGFDHQPAPEERRHRDQHEEGEEFLRQRVGVVDRPWQVLVVREAGEDPLQQDFDRPHGEHEEAPEHTGVQGTSEGVAHDLALRKADGDEVPKARRQRIGARVRGAEAQVANEPLDVEGEKAGRPDEESGKRDVGDGHRLGGAESERVSDWRARPSRLRSILAQFRRRRPRCHSRRP